MQSSSVVPAVNCTLESSVEPQPVSSLLNTLTFPKIVYQGFGLPTRNLFLRIVPKIDNVLSLRVVVDDTPKRITDSVFQVGT